MCCEDHRFRLRIQWYCVSLDHDLYTTLEGFSSPLYFLVVFVQETFVGNQLMKTSQSNRHECRGVYTGAICQNRPHGCQGYQLVVPCSHVWPSICSFDHVDMIEFKQYFKCTINMCCIKIRKKISCKDFTQMSFMQTGRMGVDAFNSSYHALVYDPLFVRLFIMKWWVYAEDRLCNHYSI